jgi:hypothetical protein
VFWISSILVWRPLCGHPERGFSPSGAPTRAESSDRSDQIDHQKRLCVAMEKWSRDINAAQLDRADNIGGNFKDSLGTALSRSRLQAWRQDDAACTPTWQKPLFFTPKCHGMDDGTTDGCSARRPQSNWPRPKDSGAAFAKTALQMRRADDGFEVRAFRRQRTGLVRWPLPESLNRFRIRPPEICRLRLAPVSGISALPEMWPSG